MLSSLSSIEILFAFEFLELDSFPRTLFAGMRLLFVIFLSALKNSDFPLFGVEAALRTDVLLVGVKVACEFRSFLGDETVIDLIALRVA